MKEFIRHDYDDIGRKYIFSDGTEYYSVTTMIGNTKDKRFLEEWRQKVGRQKAEAITRSAGNIGTAMHECLEQYMLNNPVDYPNAVIRNLSRQIIPYIDKRVKHVYSTEKVLYSDKLKLAGTVDGIVDYLMGRTINTSILDFKTAGRVPKMKWIYDYFIQMCLYAMMIAEMQGTTPIKYGVLLFAFKKQRSNKNQVIIDLEKYNEIAINRIHSFNKLIGV